VVVGAARPRKTGGLFRDVSLTTRLGPRDVPPASRWTTRSSEPLGGPTVWTRGRNGFAQPGNRYIDFLIRGSSASPDGKRDVGARVRGGAGSNAPRLLKRFAATPMRRSHYLLSFCSRGSSASFSRWWSWWVRLVAVRRGGAGLDPRPCDDLVAGIADLRGHRPSRAARPRTVEGVSAG